MKKVYDTYFRVAENERIHDRVMFSRVTASAIFIVSCLLVMALTAYAYFTCNVSSSFNTIKSAYFQTTVSVVDNSQNPVNIKNYDTQIKKATLLPNIEYSVTVSIDNNNSTAKTGFCIISCADCAEQYHTVQLSKDNTVGVNEISFILKVTRETKIVFTDSWGTSSYFGDNSKNNLIVDNGEIITVSVINTSSANLSNDNDKNETAETTGPDLTPQTSVPQYTKPIQTPETTDAPNTTAPTPDTTTGTPETITGTPETTTGTPETATGTPETTTGTPETMTGTPETTTGTPETTTGTPETTTGTPETMTGTPETTTGTPETMTGTPETTTGTPEIITEVIPKV